MQSQLLELKKLEKNIRARLERASEPHEIVRIQKELKDVKRRILLLEET